MSYYSNEFENTKDYLEEKSPMIKELLDIKGRPDESGLFTHLRMMYGHVNWDNMLVKLTSETIRLIKANRSNVDTGVEVIDRMKEGDIVALLNSNTMGPVTFNEIVTKSQCLEVLDIDMAIERAAHWVVDQFLDSEYDFELAIPYILVAFRLAVLQEDCPDDERFSDERLNLKWRKTIATLMFFVGKKLQQESLGLVKGGYWITFELEDREIKQYLETVKNEEEKNSAGIRY